MDYRYNQGLLALKPSASIAFMDRARAMKARGEDVINLAGGEPDFDTPDAAALAGIRAIAQGKTHYTAGRGLSALREAIAKKLREENGIPATADTVLVTPGGKAAIYCAVRTFVGPGDRVLLLDPAWVSYEAIVVAAGGEPAHVDLDFADGFRITRERLEAAVSPQCKMLIINTPNNPTGRVLTPEEAKVLGDFARDHDLMLLADEIYEKILFEGEHLSLGSLPELQDRVITVNGLSKSSAMTGWRLGYLNGPREVVDRIYLLYQHIFTCLPEFVQEAGLKALSLSDEVARMTESYRSRRDSFLEGLSRIPGFRCIRPEGAFYAWVQVDRDGAEMAELLLQKAGVVTVPGGAYGENSRRCIRLCFAASPRELEQAVARMEKVMKEEYSHGL